MADLSKTVEIIFAGVDRVSNTTASIAGNVDSLAGKLGDVTQPLADMAAWVEKADAAILGLGGVMIGLSVNEAAKFQTAFNEISTLFQAAPADVDAFRSAIQDYASRSTQSIESINHAVYEAISAGVSYKDSLDLLNTSEKLAVAGKADLTQTTLALVSVMNAYGMSTKDAADVSDIFFNTVKLGQITIPELASQIGALTGIAGAAKVPLDVLGAAIAALTTYGLTPEKAITDLKYVIQGIIDPTDQARKAADALGIQFGAQALASEGLAGVLANVQTKTGGNVEQMAKLFTSTEAMTAAVLLSRDAAGKFSADLAEMANRAGATDAAFKVMADNFNLAAQNLRNNIDLAFGKAGQELLETATGDVRSLSDVFKALGTSIDAGAFDPLFDQLRAFGITIEDLFQHIAQNLPAALEGIDWTRFTDSLDALKDAFGGLFDNVDLTTVEGLHAAIQKVIDVIAGLLQTGAGIVQGLKPFFDMLASGADSFSNLDASTQRTIGSVLGFAQGVNAVAPAVSSLATAIESLATVMSVKFVAGLIGASTTATAATAAFATVGAGLTGLGALFYSTSTAADDMDSHFQAASFDAYSGSLNGLSMGFGKLLATWDQTMGSATEVSGATGKVADALTAATDPAYSFEKTIADADALAKAAGVSFTTMATDVEGLQQKLVASTSAFGSYRVAANDIGATFADMATNVQTSIDKARGYHMTLVDGVPTFTQYGGAHDALKIKLDATKTATDANTKASQDFQAKMEEIASNERIKLIESVVKLNVAEVEADTKRIEAAFKSLDTTITSTGSLIGTLVGGLDKISEFDKSEVWALIDKEGQRRDEALKLQKELTEAQIANIKAKTDALNKGEAIIKIDGSGLDPELEAFMWRILERIQVRANAELTEYLLGVAA